MINVFRRTQGMLWCLSFIVSAFLFSCGGSGSTSPQLKAWVVERELDASSYSEASGLVEVPREFGGLDLDVTKLTITNLTNQSVFLVKVHTGPNAISGNASGLAYQHVAPRALMTSTTWNRSEPSQNGVERLDFAPATRFNSQLPPRPALGAQRNLINTAEAEVIPPPQVGDASWFYIESDTSDDPDWVPVEATLEAIGAHCYVWIWSTNKDSVVLPADERLSRSQAELVAEKFDLIYPLQTNLLGYEYGGGLNESDALYGGIDGDSRVHLLFYDIFADYDPDEELKSGIVGYFHGKDQYTTITGSNRAEIMYFDTGFYLNKPEVVYSTLIHEFQHMIHFNRKALAHNLQSPTWYNEMLSLLAEDLIGSHPDVGIAEEGLPWKNRPELFCTGYLDEGLTEWGGTLSSYSQKYLFGAWLARTRGGPVLIKAMIDNSSVGTASILEAVQSLAPASAPEFPGLVVDFVSALSFQGSGSGLAATITGTIGGIDYSLPGFDLWSYNTSSFLSSYADYFLDSRNQGPVIAYANTMMTRVGPNSFSLHSESSWQDVSGTLSITFEQPVDPDVKFYLAFVSENGAGD